MVLAVPGAPRAAPINLAEDCAAGADQVRLRLTVTGVAKAEGTIAITVYPSDPSRFLSPGGKLARIRVPAAAPVTTACLAVPAAQAGKLAIAIYHDANDDRNFNRTMLGMPAEGYGFSNDAPTTFGLPSFDSVRFDAAPGDTNLTIPMHY